MSFKKLQIGNPGKNEMVLNNQVYILSESQLKYN